MTGLIELQAREYLYLDDQKSTGNFRIGPEHQKIECQEYVAKSGWFKSLSLSLVYILCTVLSLFLCMSMAYYCGHLLLHEADFTEHASDEILIGTVFLCIISMLVLVLGILIS